MTFRDICVALARLYGFGPNEVSTMTPAQTLIYLGEMSADEVAAASGAWHLDARFPGKRMRTVKDGFSQIHQYIGKG